MIKLILSHLLKSNDEHDLIKYIAVLGSIQGLILAGIQNTPFKEFAIGLGILLGGLGAALGIQQATRKEE
jgi:hypothetical protein